VEKRAAFVLIAPETTIPLPVGSFVIGRDPGADIPFDRPQLSRRHARLVVSEDSVDVEDLGSTNGTWVDSYLVQHRLSIRDNARLKLGDLEVTLQRARGHEDRDPSLSRTSRDAVATVARAEADIVTQQSSAFAHQRASLLSLVEARRFDTVKKNLDPVLAEIELSSRPLSAGSLDAVSEVALRFAMATRDAAYVDAVVRIHQANDAIMSDPVLTLLDDCIAAGLEPDPRNAEEYLTRIEGPLKSARAHKLERIRSTLSEDGVTLPAPAPARDSKL
jgi:pSer/pThr/pTyr-binding forkhead associated (FHA) protein